MFDFKQANDWLKASNLGHWEVYPRDDSKKAAVELQKVANKQNRGKRHFNVKSAANIRNKNDTYVFIGADGTPAVYVIAFWNSDRVCLDDILGCETSGAVEPHYVKAVKALTQSDVDFKMKVEESAKIKIEKGEALKPEEKVFVKTFLPPSSTGYEVQSGLIGGGMGFMQSVSKNRNRSMAQETSEEAQPQHEKKQKRGQDNQLPDDSEELKDETDELIKKLGIKDEKTTKQKSEMFDQLALITIIKENLVMNSGQIRQILESIENDVVVENENGEIFSVTLAMTKKQFDQIEEFLDHPDNAKYGIKRGKKYIKLRDKIKQQQMQQETAEKAVAQTQQEQQKTEEAENAKDIQNFEKELESQLENEVLSEPNQDLKARKELNPKLKKFTEKNKRVKIKSGQIRTKQY